MDKARAVMVGDRLDSDIQFGNEGGVDTLVRVAAAVDLGASHRGCRLGCESPRL